MSHEDQPYEDKKISEPRRTPDNGLEHKESGQIEPMMAAEAPLPSESAHKDDD